MLIHTLTYTRTHGHTYTQAHTYTRYKNILAKQNTIQYKSTNRKKEREKKKHKHKKYNTKRETVRGTMPPRSPPQGTTSHHKSPQILTTSLRRSEAFKAVGATSPNIKGTAHSRYTPPILSVPDDDDRDDNGAQRDDIEFNLR